MRSVFTILEERNKTKETWLSLVMTEPILMKLAGINVKRDTQMQNIVVPLQEKGPSIIVPTVKKMRELVSFLSSL